MDAAEAKDHVSAQQTGKRRHRVDEPVVQMHGLLEPILLLNASSGHHPLGRGHNHFSS